MAIGRVKSSITGGLLAALLLTITACSGTLPVGNDIEATVGNLDYVYATWDTLLARHVTADRGLVDYKGMHDDPLLQPLHDSIVHFDMTTIDNREDSLAFWINAYNVMVIYHLPQSSNDGTLSVPNTVDFKLFSTKFMIGAERITLDELEKGTDDHIKKFNEPRTHFALVCAALSCPPLLDRAYRGELLYRQLDQRTRQFIADTEFNRLEGDQVKVSSLFDWYTPDYAGFVRNPGSETLLVEKSGGTVNDFIASYIEDPALSQSVREAKLGFLTYDWTVNAQ
jgi:hypothetical protein